MKTLQKIYWLRLALGFIAAIVSTGYVVATNVSPTEFRVTAILNGLAIAIMIYLLSNYVIRRKFTLEGKKMQKLQTTGIGIYFLTWIVFWILLYTLIV
ncbi:MAG: hypothetical protein QW222_07375 [Candidatus Bathyarchaeia archaeon]